MGICAKFGQITGIDMPTGKAQPATVHFNRREDAEECVRLVDGRFIGGWVVHLSVVNPLRDRGRPVRMWPPQWQYRRDLPGVVPPPWIRFSSCCFFFFSIVLRVRDASVTCRPIFSQVSQPAFLRHAAQLLYLLPSQPSSRSFASQREDCGAT